MTSRSGRRSRRFWPWASLGTALVAGLLGAAAGVLASPSGVLTSAVTYGRTLHWTSTASAATPQTGGPFTDVACFQSRSCFTFGRDLALYVQLPATGAHHLVDSGVSTMNPGSPWCDKTGACWGLGTSVARKAYLDQSVDGGVTWSEVPNVGLDRPVRSLLLSCVDLTTCVSASWAPVGGVEYAYTTDGGRRWTSRPLPGFTGVSVLHCSSSEVCFMSLEGAHGSSPLLRSDDGGEEWHVVHPAIPHPTGLPYCTTAETCWAWGAMSVPDDYGPELFSSTDGGKTWGRVDIPQALFSFLYRPWCSNDKHCWAFGFDSENRSSALVTTTDGGRHWRIHDVTGPGPTAFDPVSCPTATSCIGLSQMTPFASFPRTWVLSTSVLRRS